MFREMRRKRQLLSEEESISVLKKMTSGVLALSGDEGYPYAVPLSYVYHEGKLYFHSALGGHKIDAIRRNDKASFCVIGQDQVIPEEYTTYFRSVIVFGRISVIEDTVQKWQVMELLSAKYSPRQNKGHNEEIEKEFNRLCIIELDIEHISGKEAIELVKARGEK